VDSPWAGINLDTGNFTTDVYEQIAMCVPHAVNFQMKTDIRENGETKPCDWDRVLTIAARARYRGYLALEYEGKGSPATEVPRLTARLRQLCSQYSVAY
jgi:sugar phosphate isomerase/epimerase